MQSNFMMAESKKKGPLGSGQKEEAGSRSLKPYPDEEVGMIDYARMGLRIRTRRREFNMTQEQLADKVGITITHMCRIEGGARPGLNTLLAISRVLQVSMDSLLGIQVTSDPYIGRTVETMENLPAEERQLLCRIVVQTAIEITKLLNRRDRFLQGHAVSYQTYLTAKGNEISDMAAEDSVNYRKS